MCNAMLGTGTAQLVQDCTVGWTMWVRIPSEHKDYILQNVVAVSTVQTASYTMFKKVISAGSKAVRA
jgi:hypothetical protein